MATPISTVDLYNAYLAYFGRPPEPEGLAYYSNKTEAQVLAAFSASEESRELLVGTNLADSINNVYLNLFNRDADTAGLNYWIEQIAGGTFTLAEAAMAILRGAQGDDLETVNAKNDAMVAFVAALDTTAEIIGYSGYEAAASARAFIATVGFAWDNGETVGPISVPTEAEIDAAVVAATTPGAVVGQELFLGVAQDRLNGDIAGDTFVADVMQNQLGAQVNSLGTGDRLDGNGGTDSLMAQVTEGANYGGLGAPIQPRTTSIEVVKLEALNSDIGTTGTSIGLDVEGVAKAVVGLLGSLSGNGLQDAMYNGSLKIPGYIPLLAEKPLEVATTEVYVNAKDMTDVDQMWSWYSDANLTVQNMTTLDENGGMRNLADMTIGMGYSGNKDSHWNESDYKVYFDQDYLVPGQSYNNQAFYWLLDQDAEQVGAPELSNINVDGFLFKIGDGPMLNLQSDAAAVAGTWAGFIAALQAPLQAMIAAGQVPADTTLTLDPTKVDYTYLDDGSKSGPIPAMVIGTKENVVVKPLGFSQVEDAIGEFNVYGRFSNDSQVDTDLLQIGVALEKVGLAGPGGELVIGSMDKTECNVWSDDKAGHGIQQFNVTVYGNEAKSSSLAGLHSTNNNLEKVVVVSGVEAGKTEKDYADLTIGNSNTRVPVASTMDLTHVLYGMGSGGPFNMLPSIDVANGSGSYGEDNNDNQGANGSGSLSSFELQFLNDQADCFDCDDVFSGALKDVQTFDSSAFLGDLTLFASLTSEITDKYLNLQDTQDDPTADNVEFDYITGVGDDYVALTVSANNYADAGAATREDFELVINTGAGNDQVVLDIVDCDGEDDSVGGTCSIDEKTGKMTQWGFDNWYDNQKLNANMTIVTGTGNDVVRTGASGDFIIDTGADNDTVYLQNTGDKAVWVYNTITNTPIHTEITNLQSDANNKYYLFDATLTVQFRHLTATVAIPNGAAPSYQVSDLQINQAIKKAINSDPVLSKLLVANDGPANTLVVSALIDGDQTDSFGLLGDDLLVKVNSPKVADLSSGEVSQLATAWNLPGATAASLVTYMDSQITAFNTKGDYGQTYATHAGIQLDGSDSMGTSDNHVTPGAGNDVTVLGTGWLSNDVVIYNQPAFGNDVIVNFDSTWYEAGGQWEPGATYESIVLTFSSSDGSPVAQTIVFDGDTVNLAAPVAQGVVPALDVAQQFADQFDSANWKVVSHSPGSNTVTIQHKTPGAVTDATTADFTGTYFGGANGNGTVGLAITQGTDVPVNGSAATFTVTYTTATTSSTTGSDITWGGGTAADVVVGYGSLSIAQEVAGMSIPGWSTSSATQTADKSGWSVTFTATANGVVAAPPTAADFFLEATDTNNVFGSFSFTQGVDNSTRPPQWVVYPAHPDCGYDQLDFTGLGGKGSQFAGTSVSETNGSITVQALTSANDTAAEIAALYGNDSATPTKHIFITYDTKNEGFGNVWQVVDAAGVVTGGNTTATLMGTIDLADTPWASLHAVNFV